MLRITLGLLFSLALSPAFANPCLFTGQDLSSRPPAEKGPTEINLRVYVNDVIKIDDAEQSFTSDVFFRGAWKDPRLTHPGPDSCTAKLDEVWHPGLRLLNRRSFERDQDPILQVSPDGSVTFSVRGFGDFSFRADLKDFPFDEQKLGFNIITNYGDEDVRFVVDPEQLGTAESFSVANWNIEMIGAEATTQYVAPVHRELVRLDVSLHAERLTGYYTWQQMVPLCLVVMMTWVVFWIPLEYVPPRVGLAATSMLTLIAYRFAMSSVLPPIAYLTRLDVFMIGASVLVFGALAAAVAVTWIAHTRSEALAERINRHSRWLSPLVLVLMAWFAFYS